MIGLFVCLFCFVLFCFCFCLVLFCFALFVFFVQIQSLPDLDILIQHENSIKFVQTGPVFIPTILRKYIQLSNLCSKIAAREIILQKFSAKIVRFRSKNG